MSNPLHAAHYADSARQCRVAIAENVQVARDTYRVRLHCEEIAGRILPGQFVMVRLSGCNDPLLGRPLAVYDVVPDAAGHALDLIYHVKGRFTTRLARCERGQPLDLWGPLGNGFPVLPCTHLVMVAGGVGQTPFLTLAKEHLGRQQFGAPPRSVVPVPRVTLCFGAQSHEFMAGIADFEAQGVDVRLATEDGSAGQRGLVTELLEQILAAAPSTGSATALRVVCCGPEAMMRTAAQIAARYQVPCLVSLETPMACGIGICFTCVAKIRQKSGWDYKRTCVEGPVFDARDVCW
ncbi:MAG: dihydroorotate dehydrogenase electron transfer subunit [Planctomycetaceae bacterium]|nr:dihydroorotate dehydrogenase electron transfer subunit [Planctomycetaceae bacterium]